MEWNHLPVDGGIYDQSPELIDDFFLIWAIKGQHERKQKAKEEVERKRQAAKSRMRR